MESASAVEKDKIEVRPTISFVPESTVDSERPDKHKDEFILVTCRYSYSAKESKKNNYIIQVKYFETETIEDILHWYITLQKCFQENSCEDKARTNL